MDRAGAPMRLMQKRLGDEGFEEASRKARDHIRAKLGDGVVKLQGEAIFTSGTR
jgi:hypothetical protein